MQRRIAGLLVLGLEYGQLAQRPLAPFFQLLLLCLADRTVAIATTTNRSRPPKTFSFAQISVGHLLKVRQHQLAERESPRQVVLRERR